MSEAIKEELKWMVAYMFPWTPIILGAIIVYGWEFIK